LALLTSTSWALLTTASAQAAIAFFSPTGSEQGLVVPAGVRSSHVVAVGGEGGSGDNKGGLGGLGAVATAELSVTPGELLYVEVGGNGGSALGFSGIGGIGGTLGTPGGGGFWGGGGLDPTYELAFGEVQEGL
jgi:hypothetical protein